VKSLSKVLYPWFKREDVDGFFALFQNNLANFALLAVTMLGFGFSAELVFGRMVMGAAIAVAAGNVYYAFMAKRLAQKEGRTDVTALSYGISTPPQFIYMIIITGAVLGTTGNHTVAWQVAIAACMLGGIIEVAGGFIGRWVRANIPRAAMLGALAGVALTFIAGELYLKTFASPIIGAIALVLILIGMVAQAKMPGKIPAALFAVLVGTILAYVFKVNALSVITTEAKAHLGFYFPIPVIGDLITGMKLLFTEHTNLLAVILPISVYNFIETMNNVEAVAAQGDNYDVREAQFADGVGTIIGSIFGGILPTTVYIASVGSKELNAGRGYSILNGGVFFIAALFGVIGALAVIIPQAVIAPILVYVGIMMVANAFMKSPHRHAPAVAVAMLPYFANYLSTRFNGGAPEVVARISPAIVPLAQGAMFTALLLGALTVFLMDRHYIKASICGFIMAAFSFVGLMHAPKLMLATDFSTLQGQFVIGYLIVAGFCLAYHFIAVPLKLTPPSTKSLDI